MWFFTIYCIVVGFSIPGTAFQVCDVVEVHDYTSRSCDSTSELLGEPEDLE